MHSRFPRAVLRHPRILSGLMLPLVAGWAHAAQAPSTSQKLIWPESVTFIEAYVDGCLSGAVSSSDCGPVWQLGVIAAILMASIMALALLRWHAYRSAGKADRPAGLN
jgi:hypothetical protein